MTDTTTLRAQAVHLFAQPCQFMIGATELAHIPSSDLPEFAMVGRSNVGKSSLLNAMVGQKALARTSNTPGRTQQLNFFNLGGRMMLVDLPGYGYAKASKQDVAQWNVLMKAYLRGRPQLQRVCVLIDARHGIKPNDVEMMEMLDTHAVSYQLVLTKCDKVAAAEIESALAGIEARRSNHPALYPQVTVTSSQKRLGIDDLRLSLYERILGV